MCLPLGPAICAGSAASSSDRTTIPICCTNPSTPFFVASIASSSGSISCCIAMLIVTGVPSCFRSLTAALFDMTAPLPLRAHVLADLILRPAEEPSLLQDFNKVRGIPAPRGYAHEDRLERAGEVRVRGLQPHFDLSDLICAFCV